MSVILVTDTHDTVRTVIESLAKQTIAKELELVLVSPDTESCRSEISSLDRFHSVLFETTGPVIVLGNARAAGVRAASAPVVFIAETHAYPDPRFAETLLDVLSGDWSVAVPGFRNANPINPLSWAGFLSDYGRWAASLPAGETERPPSHDVAFRRDVLLEFGDRLDHALTFGDEMYLGLVARGHRAYFEPAAGIQHVNIARFGPWIRERFVTGVLIAGYRSTRWGWPKRLAYAVGSPLIPIVILGRISAGVLDARKRQRLPTGTLPAIVMGVIAKAAGEFRGYTLGAPQSADDEMTGFEIRKLSFNSPDRT